VTVLKFNMKDLKNNTTTKQNTITNPVIIDAVGLHYRELNARVKLAISECKNGKCPDIILNNVLGHRYIGDGVKGEVSIIVNGTPGNDMAAFMDGPQIEVFGNGQDGIGNTMNSGRIIIHGDCGDILGYSMRGGEIYVKGNVGWRSGIHMKSYLEKFPVIVIGGKAGDFLGEYMAGGIIILLGLDMEKEMPTKVRAATRFDMPLARRMYASGDMILMPSRYEPCGLAQMIAMRYGCVPVARSTGGLKDTILDLSENPEGTGFLFENISSVELATSIRRALDAYSNQDEWVQLQKRCMSQDFSWEKSALEYSRIYLQLYGQ
jgi:formylmethanofuran dehydrogenase subunit C